MSAQKRQLPSLLSRPLSVLGSLPGAVDALPRLLTRPRWQVGEGTYGVVYKARDRQSGSVVALKQVKILNSREGFPVSRLRTAPHAKYRAGPTRTTPARAAPD